jgi:phage terminase large subunit-like protein
MPGPARLSDTERHRRGTYRQDRPEDPTIVQAPRSDPDPTPSPLQHFGAVAARYTAEVLSGKIPAGQWTRLACARQQRDLARWTDPAWPYIWQPDAVAAVCGFIERLPHVEGKWATATITLEPAQVFLLSCLFGWRLKADGTRRRFTTLYLEMGRKGAKSTLMAAIALYHLLEEGEPGPHVICGATTGSQARIVFDIAAAMVTRCAWLRARGLQAYQHSIRSEDGWMKPINAKASTQDGLNPSCIILDESHAQNFKLHDVLKSAQGARDNPLLLCPTTAGYDLLSVGYALRTTMTKILEGVYSNEHFLGVMYSLDEGDNWRDEALWIKANPMLGIAPKVEQLRRQCLDAQQTPALEAEFRVKCCGEWQNAASTWLSMAAWDRCADPALRLEAFAGQPCWMGADLAQRDDLAAVALVFEWDDRLVTFVRCYMPADVIAERARAVPEYRLWQERGEIVLTEGNMIAYDRIEQNIREWAKLFRVQDICFDQFGAWHIAGNLAADGLPARTELKNARTCTPGARELEARVKHGRFRHDGNTCLRWMASNVVVARGQDDSIVPKKEHADSPHKIDGIDALVSALGGWTRAAATTPDYAMVVFG